MSRELISYARGNAEKLRLANNGDVGAQLEDLANCIESQLEEIERLRKANEHWHQRVRCLKTDLAAMIEAAEAGGE